MIAYRILSTVVLTTGLIFIATSLGIKSPGLMFGLSLVANTLLQAIIDVRERV